MRAVAYGAEQWLHPLGISHLIYCGKHSGPLPVDMVLAAHSTPGGAISYSNCFTGYHIAAIKGGMDYPSVLAT